MTERRVVGWISWIDAETAGRADIGGWGGVVKQGDDWAAYIAEIGEHHAPYYEALRRAVLARGLRRGGDWHQNAPDGVPLFDDGTVAMLSMRAWGDVMAALWSAEDRRPYSYMDFYVDSRLEDAGIHLSPPR